MSVVSSARRAPLSARAVDQLKASAFVGGVAGLQLVVSAGGTRSWRLYYRVAGGDGRRRGMSLGRYPEVSLAEARNRAAGALAQAADGRDPKTAREDRAEKSTVLVADAVARYLTACASANDPKTLRDKRSAFDNHFLPVLGARPVLDLKKAELLELLDGLAERPAIRRNLYAYLRHFFGWTEERDLIAQNPLLGVKPPKPVPQRERVLTDPEIRKLWRAEGVMADIARLSLLTAQRKGSIEALRIDQIDVDAATWLVPATNMKSAKPHLVPLSSMALDLIWSRPLLAGPHLFGVGSNGARPYAGASNGFESLKRKVGFDDWRLHDLRRTAVTLAQRGGAPLDQIRALTQHKTPGVIGVYARHAYVEEKRRVAEIIEAQLRSIFAPQGDGS